MRNESLVVSDNQMRVPMERWWECGRIVGDEVGQSDCKKRKCADEGNNIKRSTATINESICLWNWRSDMI